MIRKPGRQRPGPFGMLIRARRPLRRTVPPISVVPTLLTLGNLICGFAAIYYAARPEGASGLFGWSVLTVAGALVFLGMFFDSIDGSVARITRSTSDLGAQLDSLADVVTFGVAPAFMMLRLVSQYVGPTAAGDVTILAPGADNAWARMVWGVAAVYVACTALRLARFNVETPSHAAEDHRFFRGLPSPAAGGTVASLIVLHQNIVKGFVAGEPPAFERWTALGVPLVTLLCAGAMVSTIRYSHLINRYLRRPRDFATIVRIVVPVLFLVWWFHATLALFFTVYALSGPARWLWVRSRRRTVAVGAGSGAEGAPEELGSEGRADDAAGPRDGSIEQRRS